MKPPIRGSPVVCCRLLHFDTVFCAVHHPLLTFSFAPSPSLGPLSCVWAPLPTWTDAVDSHHLPLSSSLQLVYCVAAVSLMCFFLSLPVPLRKHDDTPHPNLPHTAHILECILNNKDTIRTKTFSFVFLLRFALFHAPRVISSTTEAGGLPTITRRILRGPRRGFLGLHVVLLHDGAHYSRCRFAPAKGLAQ